jgi:hypothetical protein
MAKPDRGLRVGECAICRQRFDVDYERSMGMMICGPCLNKRDKPPAKPNVSSDQFIGSPDAIARAKRENRKDRIIFLSIVIPFTLFIVYITYTRIAYPVTDRPCSDYSETYIAYVPARCASYFGIR